MEDKLYVLELTGGKYYVGKTSDVKRRIEQHMRGSGAEWTKIHKPIKVLETRKITSEHDENNVTKDLMKKYGIENVRGGSYSQIQLQTSLKQSLKTEIRGVSDACFKCGDQGHFVKDCHEEESEDEDDEDDEDDSEEESEQEEKKQNACYRCGRTSHYANSCYAYTSEDGEYLGKPRRDFRREWSDDESECSDSGRSYDSD